MLKLCLVCMAVFIINIPFGYWRANVRRFSMQWYLAIHLPVILVIAMRLTTHLGFAWSSYVILVTAFFLGQVFGSKIYKLFREVWENVTSCLVMDLFRYRSH